MSGGEVNDDSGKLYDMSAPITYVTVTIHVPDHEHVDNPTPDEVWKFYKESGGLTEATMARPWSRRLCQDQGCLLRVQDWVTNAKEPASPHSKGT